ncbi:MAG: CdaR family protein, partial [Firmicutes bacterium]|nr:CdaR family protein [Bacillota bacterium]
MKRRGWLQNNTFVWLISIVMAFALWVAVNSNGTGAAPGIATTTVAVKDLPITVLTSPDMVAVSVSPLHANLQLSGSVLDVSTVQVQSIGFRLVANAMKLAPGVHKVPLALENPPTTAVTYSPQPAAIQIDLERRAVRAYAPRIVVQGIPAAGLRLGHPSIDVRKVRISGPATLVHAVAAVDARVNVDAATVDVSRMVTLTPVTSTGEIVAGVSLSPDRARVMIPLFDQVRSIPVLAATAGHPGRGFAVARVTVTPAVVGVTGTPQVLDSVTGIVLPAVNVSGLRGTRTFPVTVPIPFAGAQLRTDQVRVTVSVVPAQPLTLQSVPITMLDTRLGFLYQVTGGTLSATVTVDGAPSIIANLRISDVQAALDVASLTNGQTKSLPVTVSLP